jgi:hypothetical protein
VTLADWKAALDITVLEAGRLHVHLPSARLEQPATVVEFIDYAGAEARAQGEFLTFREAQERLDQSLLMR